MVILANENVDLRRLHQLIVLRFHRHLLKEKKTVIYSNEMFAIDRLPLNDFSSLFEPLSVNDV